METKVNVNEANVEELMTLPGIKAGRAMRIVESRPFTSLQQLSDAINLGNTGMTKLEGLVTFDAAETFAAEEIEQILNDAIADAEAPQELPFPKSPAEVIAAKYRHSADPVEDFDNYLAVCKEMFQVSPEAVTRRRITALTKKHNKALSLADAEVGQIDWYAVFNMGETKKVQPSISVTAIDEATEEESALDELLNALESHDDGLDLKGPEWEGEES